MAYSSKIWDGIKRTYEIGATTLNGIDSAVSEAYGEFQSVSLYGGDFTPRNDFCDEVCEHGYSALPVDAKQDLIQGKKLIVRGARKIIGSLGSDPGCAVPAVTFGFGAGLLAATEVDKFIHDDTMILPIVANSVTLVTIAIPTGIVLSSAMKRLDQGLTLEEAKLTQEYCRLEHI
jgi:hypothetical protein